MRALQAHTGLAYRWEMSPLIFHEWGSETGKPTRVNSDLRHVTSRVLRVAYPGGLHLGSARRGYFFAPLSCFLEIERDWRSFVLVFRGG